MIDQEIKAIDADIRNSQRAVDLADAVARLKLNRDFKTVVLKGYLEEEAVRLVSLRSDPSHDTPEKQAAILKDIDAIAGFHAYLRTILQMGDIARASLKNSEEMRDELVSQLQEAAE